MVATAFQRWTLRGCAAEVLESVIHTNPTPLRGKTHPSKDIRTDLPGTDSGVVSTRVDRLLAIRSRTLTRSIAQSP